MSGDFLNDLDRRDDLVDEARRRLAEIEEQERDEPQLGERVELAEDDVFRGRWRGEGTMRTRDGSIDGYLVWDRDNAPRDLRRESVV